MDSGVLVEWLVNPGDVVRKGDIVAVVDTQKAAAPTLAPAPPWLPPGDRRSPNHSFVTWPRSAMSTSVRYGAPVSAAGSPTPSRPRRRRCEAGPAMQSLHRQNRELPVPQRLVSSALLLKAAARAAAVVGELNGFWVDDGFVAGEGVHLGVAVSLRGGGLVAPAIHTRIACLWSTSWPHSGTW